MPALSKTRWEKFAFGIASDLQPMQAYVEAGFKEGGAEGSAYRLLKKPAITRRIDEIRAEIASVRLQSARELLTADIAQKASRIEAKQDRWARMKRVIDERAADPEICKVPGGDTGLITITRYRRETDVEVVPADTQCPQCQGKETRVVRVVRWKPEYAVDTGLLAEMRAHEDSVARELGQLVEKHEIDLNAKVQSLSVTIAQLLTPEEMRAFEQRFLQAPKEAIALQGDGEKESSPSALRTDSPQGSADLTRPQNEGR